MICLDVYQSEWLYIGYPTCSQFTSDSRLVYELFPYMEAYIALQTSSDIYILNIQLVSIGQGWSYDYPQDPPSILGTSCGYHVCGRHHDPSDMINVPSSQPSGSVQTQCDVFHSNKANMSRITSSECAAFAEQLEMLGFFLIAASVQIGRSSDHPSCGR